jgi:AhpD family alkylhydroperoxidase
MARLKPLDPSAFAPELRRFIGEGAAADPRKLGVLRIWAQRPELAIAYRTFIQAVLANARLPRKLIELVRLRVAYHNQCRSCMAIRYGAAVEDGVSEEIVCELAAPDEAPNLTPRERAALRYADLVASAHLSIADSDFDLLRQHFTEPEIVELGIHVGYCLGFGRVAMSWDMVDDLPARFRDREQAITPWGSDAFVV